MNSSAVFLPLYFSVDHGRFRNTHDNFQDDTAASNTRRTKHNIVKKCYEIDSLKLYGTATFF